MSGQGSIISEIVPLTALAGVAYLLYKALSEGGIGLGISQGDKTAQNNATNGSGDSGGISHYESVTDMSASDFGAAVAKAASESDISTVFMPTEVLPVSDVMDKQERSDFFAELPSFVGAGGSNQHSVVFSTHSDGSSTVRVQTESAAPRSLAKGEIYNKITGEYRFD